MSKVNSTVSTKISGLSLDAKANSMAPIAPPPTNGTNGNDRLFGNDIDDLFNGYGGDDTLNGGAGNDSLLGGDGNDFLDGGTGNDSIDGGSGVDTASYLHASTAVNVDLAQHVSSGGDGSDALYNIEGIIGSQFGDVIKGDSNENILYGRDGHDLIDGGDGRDFLSGGLGDDTIIGGGDCDDLSYFDAIGPVNVNLLTGRATGAAGNDVISQVENIYGSIFDDVLTGNSEDNVLGGGTGNDTIQGGDGTDVAIFSGYAYQYTLRIDPITNQLIVADSILGRDGVDVLSSIEYLKFGSSDPIPTPASKVVKFEFPFTTMNEGSQLKFNLRTTNIPTGSVLKYRIDGVEAADLSSGVLTSFFVTSPDVTTINLGIKADLLTEGTEKFFVTILDSAGVELAKSESISILDTSITLPKVSLLPLVDQIDEGRNLGFEFNSSQIPVGTVLTYKIEGLSKEDLSSNNLNGSVTVSASNTTILVRLLEDNLTEGPESIRLVLFDPLGNELATSTPVTVNDTSIAPMSFKIAPSALKISEGGIASYTLSTANVPVGTQLRYALSGVSAADIVDGKLSGLVSVTGPSTNFNIGISADLLTEGTEQLVLRLQDQQGATIAIADAIEIVDTSLSKPSYALRQTQTEVNEGGMVEFTVDVINPIIGTSLTYELKGISVGDISTGVLNGMIKVEGATNKLVIRIIEDQLAEGPETFSLTIYDVDGSTLINSAPIKINDTSIPLPISGTPGNDKLTGTLANDTVLGFAGDDIVLASNGHDTIDGGVGQDSVTYSGALKNFSVTKMSTSYQVKNGSVKLDSLSNIERLNFDDFKVNLTVQAESAKASLANVHKVEELYVAFFNRIPDAEGLEYWITQMNAGQKIVQIAESFYGAGVAFSNLTGFTSTMTNTDFINVVYKNVLGRPDGADQGGLDYWNAQLSSAKATRGSLVVDILAAAHSFKGDPTWGFVADLLDNKIQVAHKFAVDWGLSYLTADESISKGMKIASLITPTDTTAALNLIGVSDANLGLT